MFHLSTSLPWSAERPRSRRNSSGDRLRSSSAERMSKPQNQPSGAGSRPFTEKDDENVLFTSPNLFDDTPALNKSTHETPGKQTEKHSSPVSDAQLPDFLLQDTNMKQQQQQQQQQVRMVQQQLEQQQQKVN